MIRYDHGVRPRILMCGGVGCQAIDDDKRGVI